MIHPELVSNTFSEELYSVPLKPVVVLNEEWQNLDERLKVFLEKILSSVKLSTNHVKIVSSSNPDVLQWKDKPVYAIIFGNEIQGLAQNELLEVQGTKLIITSSLKSLETDTEAKKKLWNSLKEMFG
jgi:DNA polymerase III psi subunit